MYCFAFNLEILHLIERFFLRAVPVVPVTNMMYGHTVC